MSRGMSYAYRMFRRDDELDKVGLQGLSQCISRAAATVSTLLERLLCQQERTGFADNDAVGITYTYDQGVVCVTL